VRAHHVRVVATLADGTQLTDNVRTKDVGYTERAQVDAVLVPVIVTDRGRFVRGLQKADFEVLEDGIPQQVVAFATEDSPLDLVLAIDVSGSMENALDDVKNAVRQLLSKLRPADAATLIGFNDTTFLVAERERDQRARENAVGLLTAWGGTALYDATVRAVDLVSRSPGRKGVVLFSDGDDRHSLTPPDAAAARVQSGNAMLYSIGFGAGASVPALSARLQQYAQSTGGRAFYPRHTQELGAVFGDVIAELSNQYVLSYVSTNDRTDGAWRSIRVRVRNGKYNVRARRGYQALRPRGAGKATP
jgi:Ca-activated chloride channel homolog